jgi:hypothetical protein
MHKGEKVEKAGERGGIAWLRKSCRLCAAKDIACFLKHPMSNCLVVNLF